MKITKEKLANIIKEEIENALEEKMSTEEYEEWADDNGVDLMGTIVDGESILVPVSKPKLPKNWRTLKTSHPARYWFRMWYKHSRSIPKAKKRKVQKIKFPAQTVARTTPEEFYDRAVKAEVKGYYRVARRFYRKAAKGGYKSPTTGEDIATTKAKEMDDLVKKGRGLGKGTEFDKSRSKRKPSEEDASLDVDKKTTTPKSQSGAKASDPRSVANAALGHIGSKQGRNIFDDRVLKLHKFWVGKGYKDLDKKGFLEYEREVFFAAAYLQLDKMRSSGELPDGAYPEVKEVVKMVSEFPSKKFERYAEAGAGYYSSSVGIPMLYKGPSERSVRMSNMAGEMRKRHRKASSEQRSRASRMRGRK